jgi:hypothetical protein
MTENFGRRGTAILLACYGLALVRASRRREMLRTVFAMMVATLMVAAVTATSQAAPIAPLPSGVAADSGHVTKVWWRHRHCWRGPYGHLHCGW